MRPDHLACLLLLSIQNVYAAQCAVPPLVLPVRIASVAPGILSHGIPISLGTPPQYLVFTPSLQLNTPFIPRYTNSCIYAAETQVPISDTRWRDNDSRSVCMGIYGGAFVPEQSASFFDNGTNSPVSEPWFKRTRFADWRFMTESFIFTDYLEVYAEQNDVLSKKRNVTTSFILPNENATFGGLGGSVMSLTSDSRLLETLVAEGMAPSKSWTLSEESLCLGCIDGHSYSGEFQTFKVADRGRDSGLPCLLQVEIKSLDYHDGPTSEGVPMIENAFAACVDPGVPFLVLPTDTRAALHEAAGANWMSNLSRAPDSSGSFLRFKLESGLEVDIRKPDNTAAGAAPMSNEQLFSEVGAWGAYGQNVPVLGQPFTNSVVLRWDEATEEYGLANRNLKSDGEKKLKPLGCDSFPSMRRFVETTPEVGVIVGSIVGGFVAGLLFAAAATFFHWRGQRGVQSNYEAMRGEDAVSLRTVDTGGHMLESRMSDVFSLPAMSLRESLRSHFGRKSVSPFREPYLVGDSQVFEAPEGGTGEPSKRGRGELGVYSRDHR